MNSPAPSAGNKPIEHRPSRSSFRPHLLGITLCASRVIRERYRKPWVVQHVAHFLGDRCVGRRPPLAVGSKNHPNVSASVIRTIGLLSGGATGLLLSPHTDHRAM